ncbi:protein kinase [Streptomyces uncialis]|uniref:serine/threonine-protein kinase n=1 Tax=Streptomyces uncialis TaxID=1048205 RepID=UPI0037F8C6E3
MGPYRIVGRLGAGGMGTVYAALDPAGERTAVKVIHPSQTEDPEFRARFRREVELSRRVNGPCLVPVLAADPDADSPWLATAYAPGPTLDRYLAAQGPLTGGSLYAFAAGTAQALAALHRAGVVHRDVKPQNVILSPAGPRVLDLGIAHAADGTSVTRTGVLTGTPGWISPEHYRTGTAGPAGDMFAWGALVAHAATGRLPFGTGAPDVIAFRIMSGDPDLDGVPAELRDIVEKALAKDPGERVSAATAAEECALLLTAQSTQVLGDTTGPGPGQVGELILTQWDMPCVDDPDWEVPATRGRARLVVAVVAAVAVVTAVTAGGIALREKDGGIPSGAASPQHGESASLAPGGPKPPGRATRPAAEQEPDAGATATVTERPRRTAEPSPAYTRADAAAPTIDEWAQARVAVTSLEKRLLTSVRSGAATALPGRPDLDDDVYLTFNPDAQTVFVNFGPGVGDEFQVLEDTRAIAFTSCTLTQQTFTGNIGWPYGRMAVVYRHSMADPEIVRFMDVTRAGSCRV